MNYRMEEMKFYEPEDLEDFIAIISPEEFIDQMLQVGLLNNISGNYSRDCYDMCRNAVAFILSKLNHDDSIISYLILEELKVVDGIFNFNSHTWLRLGEYYIDLSLKQFVDNAPKLAITFVSETNHLNLYQEQSIFDWRDWVKLEVGEYHEPEIEFFPESDIDEIEIDGRKIKI